MSPRLNPHRWLPVTVFLAVSIPLLWLLEALAVSPEHRSWLAIAVGAMATGYTLFRLGAAAQAATQRDGEQA